jgi:histidinol-phosphate aminotransferase
MPQSGQFVNRPDVPPTYHGAFDYAELERLGLEPNQVLDFSVNSNPYGPSPTVRAVLAETPLERYPDREALALRRALGERLRLPSDRLVVGNGVAELLWLIAFAFLHPGQRVLIIGPTFGEYRRVSALMGAQIEQWTAKPETFAVHPAEVLERLRRTKPHLVFVCNPNNPTGLALRPEVVGAWAGAQPTTLFVVDEAYLNFVSRLASTLSLRGDNILVARSMTKDYALAGLRLGYLASHNPKLIEAVTRVRPAWNVSGPAQAAGLAALRDQDHLCQSLAALARAKSELVAGLTELGLPALPSATHYFLVCIGDASGFRLDLLRQGVLVRDCASFGLPNYVRIATRRPVENERLLAAIRRTPFITTGCR